MIKKLKKINVNQIVLENNLDVRGVKPHSSMPLALSTKIKGGKIGRINSTRNLWNNSSSSNKNTRSIILESGLRQFFLFTFYVPTLYTQKILTNVPIS